MSKNSMFWRPDGLVDAARKHPGWMKFHRACGEAGLYFDDIERQGRGYSCVTIRLERRSDRYVFHRIATGEGRGVLDAVLSGFDASVAAGWPVPTDVRELLTARPPVAAVAVITDDDLLGAPVAAVDDSELV